MSIGERDTSIKPILSGVKTAFRCTPALKVTSSHRRCPPVKEKNIVQAMFSRKGYEMLNSTEKNIFNFSTLLIRPQNRVNWPKMTD